MFWVYVFGAIALLGLAVVVSYVVWLAHKASDVFAEVGVVVQRLGQLGDLLGQIRVPGFADEDDAYDFSDRPPTAVVRPRIVAGEDPSAPADASEPVMSA